MTIYGRRIGTSCSQATNGNIVCLEVRSADEARRAGCIPPTDFSPCNPSTVRDPVLFGEEYCCPLNVARDRVSGITESIARSLTGGEQTTGSIASLVETVTSGVSSAVSGKENIISTVASTAYSAVKPTLDQAISDGVSTAIETARVEQAGMFPFSMTWPIIIGGTFAVVGLIGLGWYITRKR